MPTLLDEPKPTWESWAFGRWYPEERCGGHLFQSDKGQETDIRKQCEKGYYSTGRFHVYHTHPHGQSRCADTCQVFGIDLPQVIS